jgi:hypothetical protein
MSYCVSETGAGGKCCASILHLTPNRERVLRELERVAQIRVSRWHDQDFSSRLRSPFCSFGVHFPPSAKHRVFRETMAMMVEDW